jgi:xylulokinase
MAYLLGIDIGTTSTRAIIIDETGRVIASNNSEYPLIVPKSGWAEQHPEDWWNAATISIEDVIEKSKIPSKEILAVGLSGQMHGSVFLDSTGTVLRPAILWCDQRTQKQCDEIYQIFGYQNFIKLSFNKALPGFTAPKILWLRENEPDNYKKIFKILLPKDYVRYMLSGIFATEVSDASGTILMDIVKRNWSEEILKGLEIGRGLLPDVYESFEISSRVNTKAARLTGLLQGTPIVGGGGDQAAGAVGSGIISPGLISDSLGTSGVIFSYSDRPVYDEEGRLHAFCHAVPGKWHLMGVTMSAAGSLKWYNDIFGPSKESIEKNPGTESYKLLDLQAENIKAGSNGLVFLPYLSGERTPYADPDARGVFFGISYIHTQDHFVRSILEGVAFSQLDCLSLMKDLGISSKKIVLFGGGAKSKIWRQIIADVFDTKIATFNVDQGPAFGAALLAGVGCGVFRSVQDAVSKTISEAEEIDPITDNVVEYNKIYKIYKSLYSNLKDDFKKLSNL